MLKASVTCNILPALKSKMDEGYGGSRKYLIPVVFDSEDCIQTANVTTEILESEFTDDFLKIGTIKSSLEHICL